MIVIYRKYRPQVFAEVSGQDHVKSVLEREVASGRLAHAYLFTGPRGVGKTSLARILAKAANCTGRAEGTGEPCGSCRSCQDITEGRSLDVIEIDAASHTGVDNVREQIVERVRQAPAVGPYKVYVIDEVHMLSGSAFNALLKTLEEPPEHAVFVLATTELHKVPATVISRCQRFDFRKIPRAELDARLRAICEREGVKIAPEVLEAIARGSEGCLRDAESLLSQLLATGAKELTAETAAAVLPLATSAQVEELARAVAARDFGVALRLWEELAQSGADLTRIVADLIDILRRAALSSLSAAAKAPADRRGSPEPGLMLGPADAAATLRRLTVVREEMRRAEIPELPFEMMIMEWGVGAAGPVATTEAARSRPPVRADGQGREGSPVGEASVAAARPAVGSAFPAPAVSGPAPAFPPDVLANSSARSGALPAVSPETAVAGASAVAPTAQNNTASGPSLQDIKMRWTEVLRRAQERHHSLPYMLGATEVVACDDGLLTLGFQYPLYRDRLNEARHRAHLEAALAEVFGASFRVKAILLAQKVDGTVEPAPGIVIKPGASVPEEFADLAKEFGA